MIIENLIDDETVMIGGANNHSKFKKTKLYLYEMIKNNVDKPMSTLLIPLLNANTVTVGVFIKAGSRQEREHFGIAHFLEHMTFKGTKKYSSDEIMNNLDNIGANYNAMTGHEFTLYYISGDPRDIELMLDIIIELYQYPLYPEDDIKKECNVVLEELRMNEDNNQRQLTNMIYKTLFENIDDSMARPIIGFKETIGKMNRNQIINYRNINYLPSNCLLTVSGNFDMNLIKKHIEDKFDINLNHKKIKHNFNHKNIQRDIHINDIITINPKIKRHIHIQKDINQTIINFVLSSYNSYNINNVGADLLCNILSSGFSSRLFDLLRNKLGVSYYNNSFNRYFSDSGQMIISVGVDHQYIIKTIKAILAELKNIVHKGITEEELAKAKKQIVTGLLFQFKDPYEYLMHFGMDILYKKPLQNISDIIIETENVTMNDMHVIIKQLFRRNNIIIGTIGKITDDESNKIIQMIIEF